MRQNRFSSQSSAPDVAGTWIWREELMAKALEIGSPEVIEEALGADAARVLPNAMSYPKCS